MIFEEVSKSDNSIISESSTLYEEYPSENFQHFAKQPQAVLNSSTNALEYNRSNYSTSFKNPPVNKQVRQINSCDFGVFNAFKNVPRNLKMQNNWQNVNSPINFGSTIPSVMPFTQQQNQVLNHSRPFEQNKMVQQKQGISIITNEKKKLLYDAPEYNLLFPDNCIVGCFPQNNINQNNLNCEVNESLKPVRHYTTANLMTDRTALNQQSAIFNNGIMGIQSSGFHESHCGTAKTPQINYSSDKTSCAIKLNSPFLSSERDDLSGFKHKKNYSKNMTKSVQEEVWNSAPQSSNYQTANKAFYPQPITLGFTEEAEMFQDLIPSRTQRSLVVQQINNNQDNNLNKLLKDKTIATDSHGLLSDANQSTNDTLSSPFIAEQHVTNTFQFHVSQRLKLIYNEARDKRDQVIRKRRTALKKRFFSCDC